MALLKTCGPQIWLCLFMFRPITLKQLNRLTAIDTSSCLSGRDVTLQTAVQEVPGSMSGSDKGLFLCFFCFVVVVILLLVQNYIIYMIF